MFNLKIANIERLLKQRNNSEIIQNTSQEIADYINSICQDNKKCEQYYFQQILKLGKNDSITLENIKNIKYQDTDKISIKEEYKIFIDKLSREIRGFNKIPNLQSWVIKQLPNVLVEDYNEFFVDIKTFAGLQDNERFQHKDITRINSPKELRQIVTPFIRSEIISTTTNKEWVGEWIYNKDEVSVFKSYDPETISQISKKYQTRWCVKNPDIAKETYECETKPMYFIFIGDKVVCIIHLETNQIKDVSDLALSDISIIKKIDPVLQELKLTTDQIDFITYYKILNRSKEVSSKMDKLDSHSKINYAKELLSKDIEDINVIDKNLIIYNKELQDIAAKKIDERLNNPTKNELDDELDRELKDHPLNISQDLYLSIPRIREIYIKFWEEKTKDNVYYYIQHCPSYIGKEKVIQDSFIMGVESAIIKEPLSYLAFKGAYPEIINRHMDKFKQYINSCVKKIKESILNHPEDYNAFQESKKNIPEIFNHPETIKSIEESLVNGIKKQINNNVENYKQYKTIFPDIFDKYNDIEEALIIGMKSKIMSSPSKYKEYIKEYKDIFKNPEVVKEFEAPLLIGISKSINEYPLNYLAFKNEYQDLMNRNMDKFEKHIGLCVKSINDNILLSPGLYNEMKKYRHKIPEIFNNPEIIKSFEKTLLVGIDKNLNKDPLTYLRFKRLYPGIIDGDKFKKYIGKCIERIKEEIFNDINNYIKFQEFASSCPEIFDNQEIVKSFEEIVVDIIRKKINFGPEYYYSNYKEKFPEIFEKYNILPSNTITSNNWYKLFKSSK